jgi:predicted nucleotidyltransferase
LNRERLPKHTRRARAVAESLAGELDARAVALTGSVASGTDHPDSDIDLVAVVEADRGTEIRSVQGRMVTIAWKSTEEIEAALHRPWEAPVAVPCWREALALTDPEGLLEQVKRRAADWSWELVAERADRWAAAGVTGLAEEAHKVCGMLETGNIRAAAVNRSLLATQLPGLLAAADRILYRSENELWDLVCRAEGAAWTADWDAAVGLSGAGLAESCRAALRLYLAAAARVDEALDECERPVVSTACRLARRHGA